MRASQAQTPKRRSVRTQLVGNQQFGCEALLLQQLTHQPQRRPLGEEFPRRRDSQRKAQIKPDRVLDDHRRKVVTPSTRSTVSSTAHGRCMQRHTHQEFIRLPQHRRARRPGRQSDPRHPRLLRHPQASQGQSLARPPSALGLPLHPTSGSWLNAVESFFSKMTRQRIRRGIFRSIADLQTAISRYLKEHNDDPRHSSGPT